MTPQEVAYEMYRREYNSLSNNRIITNVERHYLALSFCNTKCKAMIEVYMTDKENPNYKFYLKVNYILSTIKEPITL